MLELARGEFIERRENVLAGKFGYRENTSRTGAGAGRVSKSHRVRFTTAASLAHELIEAKDERRLMRFQKMLSSFELLIIDELGFVSLSKTGAELRFEVFSRRYERSATPVTSNLPFNEWTEAFGSERLTGALLDRLTHHVHILEMNGESYRLKDSKRKRSLKPGSSDLQGRLSLRPSGLFLLRPPSKIFLRAASNVGLQRLQSHGVAKSLETPYQVSGQPNRMGVQSSRPRAPRSGSRLCRSR